MAKTYRVNEIFLSLQGEGIRAGTVNYFIRFQGCNLQCSLVPGPLSPGNFQCDTEFASGSKMTIPQMFTLMKELAGSHEYGCKSIVLTGGEPLLQVDDEFIKAFKKEGFFLAVETNGTVLAPGGLDWVTLSPKVAEHVIKDRWVDEVKYVRGLGQEIPKTRVRASYYLISPAFDGSDLDAETLRWCINLVKHNPEWRLSVQMHKLWKVR